jgi:hypothetical protein
VQRAGIWTAATEGLLQHMLEKIDGLCAERGRLKPELPLRKPSQIERKQALLDLLGASDTPHPVLFS